MNRDQTIRILEEILEIEMRYDQLKNISLNIEMQKTRIQYRYNDPDNYLQISFPKDFYPKRVYVGKFKIEIFFTSFVISFIIVSIIIIILNLEEFLFGNPFPDLFIAPVIASIFIALIWTVLDYDGKKKDSAHNKEYDEIVKKQTQTFRENLQNEYNKLCSEAEPIEKQKKATLDLMYNFYSAAGIYNKYWKIEATAAFLEYFESGICSSFTGYDGAYARFENDMKYKSLMGKLDNISNRLDLIADNQITLYNAISESNQIINTVSNNILSNAQTTNNYLASIDYTNKINQANIRSLTEMKALELMLK